MSLITKYAFRDCLLEAAGPRTVVSGPCYSCKTQQTLRVDTKDLDDFRAGKFAQDCFHYLTAGQREFLISGICDSCWDNMFPEEEE
ncbi:hypothetical protein EBZ39_05015 [bacterium]|nr:hypothetical protein [bacterium]